MKKKVKMLEVMIHSGTEPSFTWIGRAFKIIKTAADRIPVIVLALWVNLIQKEPFAFYILHVCCTGAWFLSKAECWANTYQMDKLQFLQYIVNISGEVNEDSTVKRQCVK